MEKLYNLSFFVIFALGSCKRLIKSYELYFFCILLSFLWWAPAIRSKLGVFWRFLHFCVWFECVCQLKTGIIVPPFLAPSPPPLTPPNKAGWAFTVNCSGINKYIISFPRHFRLWPEINFISQQKRNTRFPEIPGDSRRSPRNLFYEWKVKYSFFLTSCLN